jgi:hypothetical protein
VSIPLWRRFVWTLFFVLPVVGAGLVAPGAAANPAFDHEYQAWTRVLAKHVQGDRFDYAGLRAVLAAQQGKEFLSALSQLNAVSDSEFDSMTRDQQMAFLINAYNMLTVKLILDKAPTRSIKEIGGLFKKPWSIQFFNMLGGALTALDPVEHAWLRPRYKDYRIHAAVNCASISCPALRAEAFVASRLSAQLDEQMSLWIKDPSRNKIDQNRKVVFVSKIFNWYEKDFITWGRGVGEVLTKYGGDDWRKAISAGFTIKYLDYDWGLNEVRR